MEFLQVVFIYFDILKVITCYQSSIKVAEESFLEVLCQLSKSVPERHFSFQDKLKVLRIKGLCPFSQM